MTYIKISDLHKSFKDREVLNIKDLAINKGEIVALLGKNGSGKSTLLKIISGLLFPTSGKCEIDGVRSTDKRIRHISKFVLESGQGYYDYLTAIENINYFLSLNKIDMKIEENKRKLGFYADKLLFNDHLNKKVSELSQGNRQKLSIIVLLMTNPEIICLDEPTNGLDISSVNLLMGILYDICKNEGKTILFTSHDILFTKSLNSRVIIMNQGRIMADASSEKLFNDIDVNKSLIEIANKDMKILEELKFTKYEFKDDRILLSVYKDEEKKYILERAEVFSMKTVPTSLDDIFFKVISNV